MLIVRSLPRCILNKPQANRSIHHQFVQIVHFLYIVWTKIGQQLTLKIAQDFKNPENNNKFSNLGMLRTLPAATLQDERIERLKVVFG